ncbi:CRISPR-associated endonuclease Cas1 [Candidatus Poribacteria bacterium]|nr:CRISPR-associated endonuclease Cas1 [Candidatus Poribacteria bacterium]
MAVLYISEQGARLEHESHRFNVRYEDRVILTVPEIKLDAVLVFGNVSLTTPAISALLYRSVPTSFLTVRGQLKGTLAPQTSKNVPLRIRQFEWSRDASRSLPLARAIVRAKVRSAMRVIARFRRNHPDAQIPEEPQLQELLPRLDAAPSHAQLMGVEGFATRLYFRAFGRMCRGLRFEGRARRPPTDPVNSLLSFTYTLLSNELAGHVSARGLDPYIGFYHVVHYGRPSLALDLVEEFRHPAGDRFVLGLVNNRQFGEDDFQPHDDDGVRLRPDALKRFLRAYDQWIASDVADADGVSSTFRLRFGEQTDRLVRHLMHDEPYRPFVGAL